MKNQIPLVEDKPCTCPPILIVDDNAYNIYSLKLLLQCKGVECVDANNGQSAIDMVKERDLTGDCACTF